MQMERETRGLLRRPRVRSPQQILQVGRRLAAYGGNL